MAAVATIGELRGVVRVMGVRRTDRPKPIKLTPEQVKDVAKCEVELLTDGNYGSKTTYGAWRVLHVAIDADKAALEGSENEAIETA
jgi:hypothetical protein